MMRRIHAFLGLSGMLLLMVLAISGAILSIMPAWDRAGAISPPAAALNVADLAERVAQAVPEVEELKRLPSGKIVAFHSGTDGPAASVIDPASGQAVMPYAQPAFERWMTNLHRSLFLGDGGRLAMAAGALAMLALTLSGLQMTARRMGGWRRILEPARGHGVQRLHTDLGRLAALGLLLSTLTALYLALATFEMIPDGTSQGPAFPAVTTGSPAQPAGQLAALRGIDLAELRALTFPNPSNPDDLFHLTTADGAGYVDPVSGAMLAWQDHSIARRSYELVYMLHTGEGLWWLGLLLGLSAISAPVLGVSGGVAWWSRRRAHARFAGNVPAGDADTVILVGSEGGSTWGFARTLHAALTADGHKVHAGPMDHLTRSYPAARRMLLLTATYGDGAAPASASAFLKRLDDLGERPSFPVAVLGFGDRQFPHFCQFARDVEAALRQRGWPALMPLETIDRQSAQEFARWGEALATAMGETLTLAHVPVRPRTHQLRLVGRIDYGAEVQAPTCVLRFALPKGGLLARLAGRGFPRFAAGDLVGILPPDCAAPRYYSLASSTRDGFVEICVRKQAGGLCSGFLHGLKRGDTIEAFVKANPAFHPAGGGKPLILIGAGTGIGPLAGFIRANRRRRPMHLYFGGRDPASDFLYGGELAAWLKEGRTSSLTTAFSRVKGGGYVQDRLRADAEHLRGLIAGGAQIMVCGGRDMAAGVMAALTELLAPTGLTPAVLKAEGRYAEDVY